MLSAGILFAGTALAEENDLQRQTDYSGPQTAKRSEEEWLKLRDNVLEWDEIDGLVEEYNPQVLESFASYRKKKEATRSAEEVARDVKNQAQQLEDLAASYEMETGGQLSAASLRLQAAELRDSAGKNTADQETVWLEMQETLEQKTKEVRGLFISYYEACSAVTDNRTEIGRLKQDLTFIKAKKNKGKATAAEVKSAEDAVNAAGRKTALLESKRDQAYRDLIVSCGWTVDAQAEIGALPSEGSLSVSKTEQEADLGKALENSYLLRGDRIRLENARRLYGENETVTKAAKTLEEDTVSVREAFLEAAKNVENAAAELESAKQNLRTKQKALELAEKQKISGFVSEETLAKKKSEVSRAQETVSDALYSLIRARIGYDAIVKGAKS